jgi:hypothetical protein
MERDLQLPRPYPPNTFEASIRDAGGIITG